MRRALISLAAVLLAGLPAVASAHTPARLGAKFVPNSLGARTTLDFDFALTPPPGGVPPPLTQIELRYPDNLGIELSTLGTSLCTASILEESGPRGCPPNSVMGYGVVDTGVELGTSVVAEQAPITIFRAPTSRRGLLGLLFYAEGKHPVVTNIVFSGVLLPESEPFGGRVSIGVPLVSTLPGAPYVSVVHLRATIGPRKVTYYERRGGFTFAYKPEGILMPRTCPRGGFPFAAEFSFSDDSHSHARTYAKCPPQRHR